jgi:CRP-like cAMP-binding protein
MDFQPQNALQNAILAGLTATEYASIYHALRPVRLVRGQVLNETGSEMEHVYFIERGLVSIVADTGDAGFVEVGIVGREGVVDATALLDDDDVCTHRAEVQVPGVALRMRRQAFCKAAEDIPALRNGCLRFLRFFVAQISQVAACNAHHSLVRRLARWLLLSSDSVDLADLLMTQEGLSAILGVRRAGITVAANALKSSGAIRNTRGRFTVLNRAGLESQACDCYRFVADQRRRLLVCTHEAKAPATMEREGVRGMTGLAMMANAPRGAGSGPLEQLHGERARPS